MRSFCFMVAVAITLAPLSGCSAINHFGDFEAGDDAGPRMDAGRDAFARPDGGAPTAEDAPSEDAPGEDAPLSDDANADAP